MRPILVAIVVGLIVGVVFGVLFKTVPFIGNLVPAGLHGAVVGGAAGGAAALTVGTQRKNT